MSPKPEAGQSAAARDAGIPGMPARTDCPQATKKRISQL